MRMDGILIATTRNADLQTLGTGGQRAIQAWDQIVGYVRRTLGNEHAALFADDGVDLPGALAGLELDDDDVVPANTPQRDFVGGVSVRCPVPRARALVEYVV